MNMIATDQTIVVSGLRKSFGPLEVLKGISFSVQTGEVIALLGPSGSGKSTLLRCLNHLEEINGGRVYVNGQMIGYREEGGALKQLSDKTISAQRKSIGMVFQSFNLFRHMTAVQNVASGPRFVLGRSRDEAEARALELLDKVGLRQKASSYPGELSGGQQQRVAIARALALDPKVMLFDEPTSALDPELSQEVVATIKTLADEGQTMLIATHEMAIAKGCADRVFFMVDGEMVEDSPAAEFFANPQHERSRQFLALHTN
ncbi:amino acid ABC transporter ATP-binding protein [Pelagibacterium halotolerans]|uniref:Ectoine/hydroxyectoine ABC transporter, ATP-binding protein n=1 Tax=Pelagibacterium halotolerans (strain DSM 22347 / JCM 15775 / CGMCC 1.7692 / B2) TaxID=1082931 RepID=G4R8C4_PELHB|nr:amino acid ABC transporter ATP-binding protein [Pelagibacterium halotolerans]AEQ52368.1 ectoine/hydroxyectoine ABC transporter, ATP-binding protein [Pelagibacterium halotolerans B2]QJR17893.1 amino acid ABC transporter ATP-binding protein [Pelagibacterium halotolerans]SEA34503.1 amino acid ABC transporter ATP-binding protein, PAAT family [Pelagibacterium halotolerans]